MRGLIAAVKAGRVSRRTFTRRMVGLGLTAPFAAQLLDRAGLAQSPPPVEYKPTRRRRATDVGGLLALTYIYSGDRFVPGLLGRLVRSRWKVLAVYRPKRLGLLELMQRV